MTGRIDGRLAELGITLPAPMPPMATYVPFVTSGTLVVVSGQVPAQDGKIAVTGKLGEGVSVEQGQAAARLCLLNVLTHLRTACGGDLDRVVRVVRLGGFVASPPGFSQHAIVMNGASDLAVAVFGEAGRHARSTIGVPSPCRATRRSRWRACSRSPSASSGARAHGIPATCLTPSQTCTCSPASQDRRDPAGRLGRLRRADNPFVSHAFLSALEDSGSASPAPAGCRSTPRCATAGRLVGVAPMYAKSHSYGEYVFDHGWATRSSARAATTIPKLQVAVPFSPVPGPRLLARPGTPRPRSRQALAQACARARAVLRPRHLLHASRVGVAGRGRLAAAHRQAVPLGERGLRQLRRLPGRPESRASARRCGGSAATPTPPAWCS